MALVARYSGVPLQYNDSEHMKDRVRRLADARKISLAQVMRELVAAGIDQAERDAGLAAQEGRSPG